MADILKITTPLINKNQQVAPKPALEPTSPFQLHDLTRILKPYNQKDVLAQNNTLLKESDSPEILLDLLKDPAVTVTYLKNIFMLEEIFKLLPQNNMSLTQEIENLFHELLMPHDAIVDELIRQEQESTVFRGEFFDFLRKLSNEAQPKSDVQGSVLNLMRSINNLMVKDDVLDAVANSLAYLSKSLEPSKGLAQKLEILAYQFRQAGSGGNFAALKGEALEILKEVEESVLYSPKLQKMASITIYNLSRYNDSMEFFHEAAGSLWQKLGGEDRVLFARYVESLMRFFQEHESGALRPGEAAEEAALSAQAQAQAEAEGILGAGAGGPEGAAGMEGAVSYGQGASAEEAAAEAAGLAAGIAPDTEAGVMAAAGALAEAKAKAEARPPRLEDDPEALAERKTTSKVMDALIEMLQRQSADEEAGKGEAGQVDKILHSLLSSPCNFTPLLHFVIPAYLEDVKAFAEIWINPYDDENGAQGVAPGRRIHILMVVDVEVLGRFEVELQVRDRIIDLSLHCPGGLEERFAGMMTSLPGVMRSLDTPYRFGRMEIETLDHSRSLMEVFKTLPYKRMGVDIMI
ncbi:MAG: hypothetical protein FWG28_02955 [Clostridiales bacterium]|nr:hypothetical protein [Clostridiales bacterium]